MTINQSFIFVFICFRFISFFFLAAAGFMNSDANLDFMFALHIIDECVQGEGKREREATTAAPRQVDRRF